MRQGSNMTNGFKGMRKGFSLIEILIAILLVGGIGSITYKYYKTYYDTQFMNKQMKVYMVMNQAEQLSTAYKAFVTQTGSKPQSYAEMNTSRILQYPLSPIPEMSASGWDLNATLDYGGLGTVNGDYASFFYTLDGNSSTTDLVDFCNILNNLADSNWSTQQVVHGWVATGANEYNNTWEAFHEGNDSNYSDMEYFHCAIDVIADEHNMSLVFVQPQ